MKKLFTLTLIALFALMGSVNAQEKKTWDFTKGWSDETLANLEAGSEWTLDGTSWKETGKFTGDFVANGKPIKELSGLTRGSAGLSKNNNYLLTPTTFRLNRNNQEIIFPKLKNGQTITIKGKSANATAEDRGIKGAYDYMKLIEGPEDCRVKASLGEVTLKWKIETTSPDSVDIKFVMIKGGVDFMLFQIDEGDVIETAKIAYLSNSDAEDAVAATLKTHENTELTIINVANTQPTVEQLRNYTLLVIGAKVPADNAVVASLKEALPWTPVLNLNADVCEAWGYGEIAEYENNIIVPKNEKDKIFTDITFEEEDGTKFFNFADAFKIVTPGDYFTGDAVLGTTYVEDPEETAQTIIHQHNGNHNAYIFLPQADNYSEMGLKVISNAADILINTKQEITPTSAPNITLQYKDKNTNIILTKGGNQPKTKIFYTLDGTEPNEQSTLYTDTVNVTEACTVKATAIAEGYMLSTTKEKTVDIFDQPKTPVISSEMGEGSTTIKIACETADAQIWYNFTGDTDTLKSTKYADTLNVVITMPQNITAYAVSGGMVFSELATERVLVKNPRVVIDVAAHFSAPQWTADNNPEGKAVASGKGMFSWGANATSMYSKVVKTDSIVIDSLGNEQIISVINPDSTVYRDWEAVNEAGENPEWVLTSQGTCLIWQNTTAQTTNFGDDSNYNPLYSTDVDPLFPVTKNDIQFYKFQSGEPGNGSIQTINKYQAPLDVVVLANMQGGPLLVQVSTDSLNWTTIGEIAKTGKSRIWSKYAFNYDEKEEVYVRLTQEVASGGAKVFDIYIANQGEKSQDLLKELEEELTGITNTKPQQQIAVEGIYNLSGVRQNTMRRGFNIIVNSDGSIKKVMMK